MAGSQSQRGDTIIDANRIKRAVGLPQELLSKMQVGMMIRELDRINLHSRSQVVRPGGPVVSLTSYGARVETVHLTLETIGRGSLLPSRLILWLDDERLFKDPAQPLVRLRSRGLEICLTKNYGPHTKYYPYLESSDTYSDPLVTADDDILYPGYWLERLVKANQERPDLINCYRARVIAMRPDGLAPYEEWHMCHSTEPTIRHFATGVSGVIYPPKFLACLRQAGRTFESCCPRADDIWLHVQALRSGFAVRQFVKNYLQFFL